MISIPKIFIGFQVHDKGKLVFDNLQEGHSWTRNYWNIMFGNTAAATGGGTATFGAGYMAVKITGGSQTIANASYSASSEQNGFYCSGAVSTYGIVVGTGDTAFSVEDYDLAAQISTGTGTGQLVYSAMSRPVASYASTTWTSTIVRVFNNNSGGSITIKETGMIWNGKCFDNVARNYLCERSVLDPTVAVANGAQLTVTYTVSMDFNAID